MTDMIEMLRVRAAEHGGDRLLEDAAAAIKAAREDACVLQRDNERLEEALRELSQCDGSPVNVANAEVLAARVRSIANRALAQEDRNG